MSSELAKAVRVPLPYVGSLAYFLHFLLGSNPASPHPSIHPLKNNDDDDSGYMYVSPAGYCSYRREHAMANIYLQPYSHCFYSRNPVNQVIPGICADDAAHLPNGQGE